MFLNQESLLDYKYNDFESNSDSKIKKNSYESSNDFLSTVSTREFSDINNNNNVIE